MNLSLAAAVLLLAAWVLLLALVHPQTGVVHVLYVAGVVLLVRRIVVGAPRFLS